MPGMKNTSPADIAIATSRNLLCFTCLNSNNIKLLNLETREKIGEVGKVSGDLGEPIPHIDGYMK